MKLRDQIIQLSKALRELVAPSYRPELHYMRGPGPAFQHRVPKPDGRRQGSRFRGEAALLG